MKGLTLWEPWASLIALGEKTLETRPWGTKYRGQLLIHAARTKGPVLEALRFEPFQRAFHRHGLQVETLPYGCAVAVANLVDVVSTNSLECQLLLDGRAGTDERSFGNYDPGRCVWVLERVAPFEPVPAVGAQGLWNVDDATVARVLDSMVGVA